MLEPWVFFVTVAAFIVTLITTAAAGVWAVGSFRTSIATSVASLTTAVNRLEHSVAKLDDKISDLTQRLVRLESSSNASKNHRK